MNIPKPLKITGGLVVVALLILAVWPPTLINSILGENVSEAEKQAQSTNTYEHVDPAAEQLFQESLSYSNDGNHEKAIELLNRALKQYSGFKGFHYYEIEGFLAINHIRQGNDLMADKLLDDVEQNYKRLSKERENERR